MLGKYILDIVESLPEASSDPNYQLSPSTRQLVVDWVLEGYNYLLSKEDIIKRSFEVCGITTTDSNLTRNDEVLRGNMGKVNEGILRQDDEDSDDDVIFRYLRTFTTSLLPQSCVDFF